MDTEEDAPGPIPFERHRKRQQTTTITHPSEMTPETPKEPATTRPSRVELARERFWRSDGPITIDRWQCAREAQGWTVEDLAQATDIAEAHLAAIETGAEQPTLAESQTVAFVTRMLPRWFHMPPLPKLEGPCSLDWHMARDGYVCDPCERELDGEEIDACDRCSVCDEDICEAHRWIERMPDGSSVVYCSSCHEKAMRAQTRAAKQTRITRRNTQQKLSQSLLFP